MTVTGNGDFRVGSGGWTDIPNILDGGSGSATTYIAPPAGGQRSMTLSAPVSGDAIPLGSLITYIDFNVVTQQQVSSNDYELLNIVIGPGLLIPIGLNFKSVSNSWHIEGDLTYWGLTPEEAFDFVLGIESLVFLTERISGDANPAIIAEVHSARVSFTYEPPQTQVLSPPVVF